MNKHVPPVTQFATVEGRALATALKPMLFVVERRNTYPILSMVRLQLDGTKLRLSATDLDIDMSTTLDVNDCAGEWELCVEARTLAGIARIAGPMSMRLEKIDQATGVDAKGKPRTETQLKIVLDDGVVSYAIANVVDAPDAWPTMKGDRGDEIERFGNGRLAASLAKVERVISREETRYYLNGVCWTIGDAGRWMAATDGHRLLKYGYSSEGGPARERIVPRKTVELIVRHFAGADAVVFDVGAKIDLEIGSFTIRTKLIEGSFPDIHRVIPKAGREGFRLSVLLPELTSALSRLSAFPGRPFSARAIRFFPAVGQSAVEFHSADYGKATAPLSAEWPDKLPEFGVNGRYLSDLLRTCKETVTLDVLDAGSPILVSDADDCMTRVIMPMRV